MPQSIVSSMTHKSEPGKLHFLIAWSSRTKLRDNLLKIKRNTRVKQGIISFIFLLIVIKVLLVLIFVILSGHGHKHLNLTVFISCYHKINDSNLLKLHFLK